jgi:tetratricopeptide (TPR) repeat protein
MKNCPICSFALQGSALRCRKCQTTLTNWINYGNFARQAYQEGLFLLKQENRSEAVERLSQAVILDPDEPAYSAALGRVLGQLGRYFEAQKVLDRAFSQSNDLELKVARDKAAELAKAPTIQATDAEESNDTQEPQGDDDAEELAASPESPCATAETASACSPVEAVPQQPLAVSEEAPIKSGEGTNGNHGNPPEVLSGDNGHV